PPMCEVATVLVDLATDLGQALGDETDLVTMSALLDLVSVQWLERLVTMLAISERPLYAALSYDGRATLMPACRHDDTVLAAVNRHQLTDKGFGPALGPQAAATAPECLRRQGFAVQKGLSDWTFGPSDRDIQLEMLAGWAGAAAEIGVACDLLDDWLAERRAHVETGRSQMRVGHIDFFAAPIGRR